LKHEAARHRFSIKKFLLIVVAVVLIIILTVLAFLLRPTYATSGETLTFSRDTVALQQKVDKELQAYYQAGNYTFTDPLVVQDPYQTAPLTALLIFETPENSQISIHVPGKDPQSAVDFTFPGFQKHHEIPIYGLYADTLNHVTLSMISETGAGAQTEVDLQTEPLPTFLQVFYVDKVNPDKYSPGFNFSFQAYKVVFDLNGDVRWYSTRDWFSVFTRLKNGRYLFTLDEHNLKIIVEQDLLGKIYGIYNIPDGVHHDIYELPSGNWLLTTSDIKSSTIYDYLVEMDPVSGHIVRSFDLKNYLDPTRPTVIASSATVDWIHVNSIVYDSTDDTIIISSRNQSAVVKMTYPGMMIKWILGSHDNWSTKYQPYLLTPVGDNFEWPWVQHHATLNGPDIPGDNLVDILLFDNGTYRSFDLATAYSPLEWYSRVVHYRINEAAMTVEQVWEYGQARGSEIFSGMRGGAYLLSNGDVLGTWADIYKDDKGNPRPTIKRTDTNVTYTSKVIEIDPSNNEVVFEATSPDTYTYRAARAGFYDGYSEQNAYLSTTVNDTSRNDLVDRSVLAWRDVARWWSGVEEWSYTNPIMLWLRRTGRGIIGVLH
jgi:arylsulfate sulfotransferase